MPLQDIDLVIFDFDNTLYHSTKSYTDALNNLYAEYFIHQGVIDNVQQALDLATQYYKEYGHSVFGATQHGLKPNDYFEWVHTQVIERQFMEKYMLDAFVAKDLLANVEVKTTVFTQAGRDYALHGLSVSGLLTHIDPNDVYGFDSFGLQENNMKHHTTTWAKLADHYNTPYHRVAVVEDSIDYLKPPKALGMRTIFVENDQYFHFNFKETVGEHVDHHFKTTEDFLHQCSK